MFAENFLCWAKNVQISKSYFGRFLATCLSVRSSVKQPLEFDEKERICCCDEAKARASNFTIPSRVVSAKNPVPNMSRVFIVEPPLLYSWEVYGPITFRIVGGMFILLS